MMFVAAVVAQTTTIPIPPDVQVDNTLARFEMLVTAGGLSGNREEAGELYRRSIKDFEAVLPATHPDLMTAIEDFRLFSSEIELSNERMEPAAGSSTTTTP